MASAARAYRFAKVSSEELRRRVSTAHPELIVQTVRPDTVSNEALVEMIGAQTLEARRAGRPLARKPEVDLLMRLGGTTQIADAIGAVGAGGSEDFVLVVVGDESDIIELQSGEATGWQRVPRAELRRDELLKIERAALLDAERA